MKTPFKINNRNGVKTASLYLYGVIGNISFFEDFISANDVKTFFDENPKFDAVDVFINSDGGNVFEGFSIYNQIIRNAERNSAKITTYNDGMAGSIASVLFLAGDSRVMAENAFIMIHNAMAVGITGNADELRDTADKLDVIDNQLLSIYEAATNLSRDSIIDLQNREAFFNSLDAINYGFATEITASKAMAALNMPLAARNIYKQPILPKVISQAASPAQKAARRLSDIRKKHVDYLQSARAHS